MIDNRLLFNNSNYYNENIELLISTSNLKKYKKDNDFISKISESIYNNSDVAYIQNLLEKYTFDNNDGFILFGNLLAETIVSDYIKDEYTHIKWLDNILSNNNYIYESYQYFIKEYLQDEIFKINYCKLLKIYYQYCNKNPKMLISYRFDKRSALKILKEWNNTDDYSKIISGEWKRFYEYIFIDSSYYLIMPIIEIQDYKSLVDVLNCIDNFFIIDNILSYNQIRYDIDIIKNLLQKLNKYDTYKSITIQFLLLSKIQEYVTNLYLRIENVTEELEILIKNLFTIINKLKNKDCIYKNWFKFLTNQIIKNTYVDLAIIIIELIVNEINNSKLINEFKKELIEDKDTPYESLMSLILLEDEPDFDNNHFELLKKYLMNEKQYIFVNLHQVNKAFEPRFYYLSQLFIGNNIGEEEWLSLWELLYKERKKAMYPYFYKNTDSVYRSIFLIITGISAIQYLCEDNTKKSSKLLNYIWEAVKEIHLYLSKFYDNFIIEIVFRIVLLSEIIKEPSTKYLDFFKYNSSIITQILVSLDNNKYELDKIKVDKQYLNSVKIYINEIMNKKHVSKEYMNLCCNLYEKLKS